MKIHLEEIFCQWIGETCPRYQVYKRHQHCGFHTKSWSDIHNQKSHIWKIICDIKPDKVETHRTRLTVEGNFLDYSGFLITPTATVTSTKFLLNSIFSTINSRCLTSNIKHFYLNIHINPTIIFLNIGYIISFNYFLRNDADIQFHVFWIRDMVVQVEMFDVWG